MISLKQITYALAVERTLHFKKAAESCAVSQSALSTALAEMERQLGYQIFERDNKKVLVTSRGRQALDRARKIKIQMDDLMKLGKGPKEPFSSRTSLGIIPTIAPFLLPIVLPPLQARYPQLELDISEAQSKELVDQVRCGDLDTAILALPFPCEGLLSFRFWQENFFWITHKGDALATMDRISDAELDPASLILLKEGHCLKDHALAACRLPDSAAHGLSATSLNTLVQLVACGMGTTLVPEMALSQLVDNNPDIARVPLAEPGPHREIAFIVRPNYPAVQDIELMMELFRGELQSNFQVTELPAQR